MLVMPEPLIMIINHDVDLLQGYMHAFELKALHRPGPSLNIKLQKASIAKLISEFLAMTLSYADRVARKYVCFVHLSVVLYVHAGY